MIKIFEKTKDVNNKNFWRSIKRYLNNYNKIIIECEEQSNKFYNYNFYNSNRITIYYSNIKNYNEIQKTIYNTNTTRVYLIKA